MRSRFLIGLMIPALLLAGCRLPAPAGAPRAAQAAPAWTGAYGQVAMTVDLGAARRLLWAEGHRAMKITAEVSGAGISGWVALTPVDGTTGTFSTPADDGSMVATLSAQVPAGDRRVFRVKVLRTDGGVDSMIEELWGVADVPANTTLQRTYPVTIKRITTPTGKIFETLIRIDAAKALTLPLENVQHYVEEMLNTSALTGKPLREGVPQVSHALLDIEKATAAIVRGNSGKPFQIPVPIPQSILAPDAVDPLKRSLADGMRQRGGAKLQVVDLHHQPVKRKVVYYLTDPATEPWRGDETATAEVELNEVAPGSWDFVAIDQVRGTVARKAITIQRDQVTSNFAVMTPATEVIAGAYDSDRDVSGSYNGERVPPAFVYMNQPAGFAVKSGQIVYADTGNQRVRRFGLDAATSEVNTIAGVGIAGTTGNGGPATSAWTALDSYTDVAIDKDGVVYFTEDNGVLKAIGADGNLRTFYDFPAWRGGSLAYDAAKHHLYAAFDDYGCYRIDLNTYDPNNAAASVTRLNLSKWANSGMTPIEVVGDYLFYGYVYYMTGAYEIIRVHLPTNQAVSVLGTTNGTTAGILDDGPGPAVKETTLRGLAADRHGNLFWANATGLCRLIKGTGTSNEWLAKVVLKDPNIKRIDIDPETGAMYLLTTEPTPNNSGNLQQVPVIKRVIP